MTRTRWAKQLELYLRVLNKRANAPKQTTCNIMKIVNVHSSSIGQFQVPQNFPKFPKSLPIRFPLVFFTLIPKSQRLVLPMICVCVCVCVCVCCIKTSFLHTILKPSKFQYSTTYGISNAIYIYKWAKCVHTIIFYPCFIGGNAFLSKE